MPEDFKKIIAQMVKEQVETQVATQMAAFKEAYRQEMALELKKLVAAETQKQVNAQNQQQANATQVNRIPAKVMRAMGSPKATKPVMNGALAAAEMSPGPKTTRVNRVLAGSPRNMTATVRNLASPKDMAASPIRPLTVSQSTKITKMPNSPSKTTIKIFKPNFEQVSTAADIADPIYENKDPIGTSIKTRCEIGSLMSVSKALRTQPFFFTMELTGPGLLLEEKSLIMTKQNQSVTTETEETKEKKVKKLPDPISESIQERKDYGSYLSVVKTAKVPEEIYKFEAKGIPEKELTKPVTGFPEPVTKLSMSFVATSTPGRRSLVDRKKSKVDGKE